MSTWSRIVDADTYVYLNASTTHYGTAASLDVGCGGSKDYELWRAIIYFNLSGFTYGSASITAAQLNMVVTSVGASGSAFKCHRLTRSDWVETQATHTIYKTSNNWSSAGGDYTWTDVVSWTAPAATGTCSITGMSNLVKDAIDNRSSALHLLLKSAEEGSVVHNDLIILANHAHNAEANRPTLVITYDAPSTGHYLPTLGAGKL
jgi:hypothetical protein